MLATGLVAALAVAGLAGCAGSDVRTETRAGVSNAPGGNADRLAAAALETWGARADHAQALALADRAAAAAPDRADLAWLQVGLCLASPGCDPAAAEARLRKLDPANGVPWLDVLARAQAQRDERAVSSILEAMSRAERFDLYWTTLVWRLTGVIAASRPAAGAAAQSLNLQQNTPLTTALNDVTGWLSRLATRAFSSVTSACDPRRSPSTASSPDCTRIAEALQRSDTTLAEGLGLGIAQRLATPGTAAASALDQRVVTLSYRSQTAGAVMQSQIERDKFAAEVLELMRQLPREQDVSVAILRWAGEPLTPTG